MENPFRRGYQPESTKTENDLTPLKKETLGREINEGTFASVHEVNSKNEDNDPEYVVKIGHTRDYPVPFLKLFDLRLPRERISNFLKKFLGEKFDLMPNFDSIKSGVAEYLLLKDYYSPQDASSEDKIEDEPRALLLEALSDEKSALYQEMRELLGNDNEVEEISEVFKKHKDDNFLLKEQVVMGHPPEFTQEELEKRETAGEKLPSTYYIFQEKVKGDEIAPLYEITDEELKEHPEILEKLLTFAMLTKKMYEDTEKIPDMRPEEILRHPFEWFQKTANILVDKGKEELYFIDTRWLWEKDMINFRNFSLVDYLGTKAINGAIKKYVNLLDEIREKRAQKIIPSPDVS